MKIKIDGNIPSLKNSKQIFFNKRTGKSFITASSTVKKYLDSKGYQWEDKNTVKAFKDRLEGLEKPYKIGFYFIRDSKRKFDYINALQLPLDLMTANGWIDDDNCDEIIPVILGYEVDKTNAGVIIEVIYE